MSLYQVQKLIYHVNRDVERREHYRQDAGAFSKNYDLTEPESAAVSTSMCAPSTPWASTRSCCGRLPCSTRSPTKTTPKR